jgi:hypothetical protein
MIVQVWVLIHPRQTNQPSHYILKKRFEVCSIGIYIVCVISNISYLRPFTLVSLWAPSKFKKNLDVGVFDWPITKKKALALWMLPK